MSGQGRGGHQDAEASHPRSPAEVEVLLGGREPIVERPDAVPHLPGHQHGAGRDVEDLPNPVVLALIDLSLFQGRVRVSETVCGQADLPEDARLLPVHDLRPDDSDSLDSLGRFYQRGHRAPVQDGVVVQEEDVVGLPCNLGLERPAHGPGEPEVPFALQDPICTERRPEEIGRPVRRVVVDGQDADAGMRLSGQAHQGLAKPPPPIPHHQQHQHARRMDLSRRRRCPRGARLSLWHGVDARKRQKRRAA